MGAAASRGTAAADFTFAIQEEEVERGGVFFPQAGGMPALPLQLPHQGGRRHEPFGGSTTKEIERRRRRMLHEARFFQQPHETTAEAP